MSDILDWLERLSELFILKLLTFGALSKAYERYRAIPFTEDFLHVQSVDELINIYGMIIESYLHVQVVDESITMTTHWFDPNWNNRKKHEIIGSTFGSLVDYQIKIIVHYGSGVDSGEHVYLNGKCRPDFADIRFTLGDGITLLPYWMESKVDYNYAVFWVKLPSILVYPNITYIYVYYNNMNASTISNGANTFDYFTDMINGSGLVYAKASFSGGECILDPDGSQPASYVRREVKVGYYHAFRVRSKWYNEYGGWKEQGFGWTDWTGQTPNYYENALLVGTNIYTNGAIVYRYFDNGEYRFMVANTSGSTYVVISFGWAGDYHILEIRAFPSVIRFALDDDVKASITSNLPGLDVTMNQQIGWYQYAGSGQQYIDWFLIRKYVEPEPTHGSWGGEETKP
jgi:hypothetical protein